MPSPMLHHRRPRPRPTPPTLACRQARRRDAARLAAIQVDSWEAAYRGKLPDAVIDARTYDARTAAWHRILNEPVRRGPDSAHYATLICELDGREAGFLDVGLPRHPDDRAPRRLEVDACYVAPWFWRRGVGQALWTSLRARVSRAKTGLSGSFETRGPAAVPADLGDDEVVLWVLRDNPRAIGFYRAMGLRCDGTVRDEVMAGKSVPHVRMAGRLRAVGSDDDT